MRWGAPLRRTACVLVALVVLLGGGSGCAGDDGIDWTTSEIEEGIEAVIEHAGTGRAVLVAMTGEVLVAAMVTGPDTIEYVEWYAPEDGAHTTQGFHYGGPLSTDNLPWTEPFDLAELDVATIVDRGPCEQDYFTFVQTAVDVDDTRTYLETRCSHRPEMTTPPVAFHAYLDGEPVPDADLTDPKELAGVVERAGDGIGDPAAVHTISLGYAEETRDTQLSYVQRTDDAVSLSDHPCELTAYRWTNGADGERPGVATDCSVVDYVEVPPYPYDPALLDPEVMTDLWRTEVGDADPSTAPSVQLQGRPSGEPLYTVYDGSDHSYFDLAGQPVEL